MNTSFSGATLLRFFSVSLGISLAVTSCAPTPFVKTLEHKQHAVSASLGGPLLRIPGVATMPIPFIQGTYGYGWKPNTTLHGSWNVTSAVFGVAQFNFGVTQSVWKNNEKMGVTCSPSFSILGDVYERNVRVYPQLDANYYFNYHTNSSNNRCNYGYVGCSNWFDLKSTKAHGVEQTNHVVFNPQIGHVFQREHWAYQLEMKLLAPYKSNENIVVDYVSPFGNKGGLGVYFGVNYRF